MRVVALTNLQSLWFRTWPARSLEAETLPRKVRQTDWRRANVGGGFHGGVTYFGDNLVHLAATGTNVWGTHDEFHFAQVSARGDTEIVAHLLRFDPASDGARAGLMLRENLEAGARNVFVGVTPRGAVVQWRDSAGGATRVEKVGDVWPWLRLKRAGNEVSAHTSREGRQWRLLRRVELSLPHTVLIGLGVAGRSGESSRTSPPRASEAIFDRVQVGAHLHHHSHAPRVALKSGSMTSGEIDTADHRNLRFRGAPSWEVVPVQEVTRIDFYWVPSRFDHLVRGDQPGVLLTTGEFVEGDFRGVRDGQCLISSVLFGLKRFDIDGEVLCVVLGEPALPSGSFEVKTWRGSTWCGTLESMDEEGVVLREESMGRVTVPFYQLKEMSRRRAG